MEKMIHFLSETTTERHGVAVSMESLRRQYRRLHGPITPAEFGRQLIDAGCEISDVVGGGQVVLHRRKRGTQ